MPLFRVEFDLKTDNEQLFVVADNPGDACREAGCRAEKTFSMDESNIVFVEKICDNEQLVLTRE